jgi:hypothetical protein
MLADTECLHRLYRLSCLVCGRCHHGTRWGEGCSDAILALSIWILQPGFVVPTSLVCVTLRYISTGLSVCHSPIHTMAAAS